MEFAGDPGGHRLQALVQDVGAGVVQRAADGHVVRHLAGLGEVVPGAAQGDLGGAVEDLDDRAGAVGEDAAHGGGGYDVTAGPHLGDAREGLRGLVRDDAEQAGRSPAGR
ncbi:hypothetical protein GCM10020000_76380 [Streptomyces olivoverticillatus]